MKKYLISILLLLCGSIQAQPRFVNGDYTGGLHVVQVDKTHIRGYFESYTGMDESTGSPLFSCIFFMEGTYKDTDKYTLKTYYPFDKDTIRGELMVADSTMLHIWLDEEHGGCWNVQSFASGMVTFELDKKTPVITITYVKSDKAHFYQLPDEKTKRKGYLLKGQFVKIENVSGGFAYCVYDGKRVTKGWMRLEDLVL